MIHCHSQPTAPGAKTGSWSFLQAANTTKIDHNMNWMTCKLEAELFPKRLALDLIFQPEGSSWPRDNWVLSHWAYYPSFSHFQECVLTCLTCVSISANYWPLVITYIWHCFASCDKNEQDSWATVYQRNREGWAAQDPQRNGNLWLIKIFFTISQTE